MLSTLDLTDRRRRLRQSVFDHPGRHPSPDEDSSWPVRAIAGTIADASPHVLVLSTPDGSQVRLPMAATTSIWYGRKAGPADLRPGRHAVVRPAEAGGLVAERIWIDPVRVTGLIADRRGTTFEIDAGPHRGRVVVTVPPAAMRYVQVRHPRLESGALFDVIGIRRDGELLGLQPMRTSPQPASYAVPPPPPSPPARRGSRVARTFRGAATWYDDGAGDRGAAYPALDPYGDAGGCGTGPAAGLPYLSLGSEVHVRNECTGRGGTVPVAQCGCLAARFQDRCVSCGTSPRGRIIELSMNAFVDLGGDLDTGCFNVTVGVGQR